MKPSSNLLTFPWNLVAVATLGEIIQEVKDGKVEYSQVINYKYRLWFKLIMRILDKWQKKN